MAGEPCCCILDTSVFEHYALFTKVDWRRELEEEEVVLVVCSTVLRELDDARSQHRERRVRKRVRRVLRALEECCGGRNAGVVGDGVRAELAAREPALDWQRYGLDKDVPDDVIVAHALGLQEQGRRVVVVTGDLTMRAKARAAGLACQELRAELLLPETKTDSEKQLEEAQRRLARVEGALPKLVLAFPGGDGDSQRQEFALSPKGLPAHDQVEAEVAARIQSLAYKPPAAGLPVPPESEIGRHQHDLDAYAERYRRYIRQRGAQEDLASRTLAVELKLVNSGSAAAEDIDVVAGFPEGIRLLREEDRPVPPEPPETPLPPQPQGLLGIGQILRAFERANASQSIAAFPPAYPSLPPQVTGPEVAEGDGREVSYWVRMLKQGRERTLDPVYAVVPAGESAPSFHIEYCLIAASSPGQATGQLHVIVNPGDAMPNP